jgi:2,4-dienoyl-CoA reductase-like NADH-dependent reductase (Old Yellow Enzyme family)
LGLELVRAAKEKAGHDYPLVVRLSASERRKGGFAVEEAISVGKMLENMSVGAIDVVSGFMDTYYWSMPCARIPRGCNVEFAAEALTGRFARIYSVGDCVQPGKIWDAIHSGGALGRRI